MDRSHQCLIVLGMHRSATSLVAGGLHERGVYMGPDLLSGHHDNPDGHYESQRFLHLNIQLLRAVGGDWAHPPSVRALWHIRDRYGWEIEQAIEKTQEEADGQSWGWKDPRTTLTYPLYAPYLTDYDVFLVPCFRDVEQVAKSLQRRNGFDLKTGRRLARLYNDRLLMILEEYK